MASTINAKNTSTGVVITPDASGQLELQTADTTRMTIDVNGNVGVGTSSPSVKLDVRSSGTAVRSNIGNYGGDNNGSLLLLSGSNSTKNWFIGNQYNVNGGLEFTQSTATGGTTVSSTPSMVIDSSGNVGIGTASIAGKFNLYKTKATSSLENMLEATTEDTAGGISSTFRVECTPSSSPIVNLVARAGGNQTTSALAFVTRISGTEAERMRINTSGYVTNAVNGLGNGLVQAQQYYRLNSGLAGANVNTAQSIFGVGVTLVGSTVYEFEMVFAVSKSAGTTSHNFTVGFGGTATTNNISWEASLALSTSGFTGGTNPSIYFIQTASSNLNSGITSATYYQTILVKGTVSVNAGGTFIPQYTLSAAPGGAYTTQAGSYIKISPLSASGSNTSIGSWA